MGQALYRKYRSKSLAEVVGQKHITDTLAQALKSGRLSHAYLFTGPRGVGKTSIARILAHEVNGLPYSHEDNHLDIIEIDAASNRGIDEIRSLREKVYSAPTSGKYKVYIIDEVHMLTTPAFNALLKTLEEPPAHVIFILATTESHKLPETIVSRTQRHVFRPVDKQDVIGHLKFIAKSEGIKIDDDALELIAEHGGGSFRDSISLLDQASTSTKKVDRKTTESLLGIAPKEATRALLDAAISGNSSVLMTQLDQLIVSGYHPAGIAKQLSEQLRRDLIENTSRLDSAVQLEAMRGLLDVAPAHNPTRVLEITLLKIAPPSTAQVQPSPHTEPVAAPPAPKVTVAKPTPAPVPTPTPPPASAPAKTESAPAANEPADVPEPAPHPVATGDILDASVWTDILNALKRTHNTLYGVLRMAVPEFEPGLLRLRFQFAFHQKRMNEAKHRAIVVETILQVTGQSLAIECLHDKEALVGGGPVGSSHPATESPDVSIPTSSLSTISNIFGGGELLES